MIHRQSVASSNIASVGYDPEKKVLEVEFHKGQIYAYEGVPQEVYDGFINAGSPGSYFREAVKDSYSYSRVA